MTTVGNMPELPQDVLMGIFATLEIPDLVRAGSVCPWWHSAYTSLRSLGQYKRPQTPCLLYNSESAGESVACLYSLTDKRSEMHLVNPITCQQIALPSVITIEQVKPIFDEHGAVHKYEYSWHTGTDAGPYSPSIFAIDELRHKLHYKAFVFPDTSTGSYIVVLIHNPKRQLSFARVGDDNWTWLPPHERYSDCTYKDGLLYAVTTTGQLHAFDFSGPVITMEMIIRMDSVYGIGYTYVVQAPSGGLLLIWRIIDQYNFDPDPGASVFWNTTGYIMYEFDPLESKLKSIKRLPDHVLFLGHNQSICLTAKEYPTLRANHAYFTDDNVLRTMGLKNSDPDMGTMNLDNFYSMEEILSPQLWSSWPAPMWITPDLRKMNLASGRD
ncbi:hypothetical protein CFC21_014830 [Triticum aestivum]|uniref:F-box domain-containing protein n=2 Tax=Triticum aestivum TaxID=4565 RepID=A0A9R1IZJ4_WHEAT|nr:hypothetical protein CFC21_014826 [Triticum aestivum]KAF6998737.1 hypothetical protein CFC21_014828 [Triticum aestivum]KAF6998739.1 hypothetical protein CFC21_014830 [Triticum aestivum]